MTGHMGCLNRLLTVAWELKNLPRTVGKLCDRLDGQTDWTVVGFSIKIIKVMGHGGVSLIQLNRGGVCLVFGLAWRTF